MKVQDPDGPVLTTRLYVPDESRNARDGIFRSALLIDVGETAGGKAATFNFVLDG